ncbi:MAG: ABC transporter ATP-binding protein, partial [Gammaproteobacteria bacterium]|nr:ABC transporter ATP-binding protein [Gammaproteobacteria bacterium]
MINLHNVYKHYQLYNNDFQRLKEVITGHSTAEVIKALNPISITIEKGQVVGIIGDNGAGKSTLLKLISGTASPSGGTIETAGRIAALLELGTGFHPELSGHENIYLYGAILGISRTKMDNLYDDIVAFSGVEQFIHQPVKTYSSGMFVRLAFSVATSVDPDILIIDEALSVGDGNFARKSFDRIMNFKESGKTILFCSHSMFHIESICDRAIWIDDGQIKMDGLPA